MKGIARNHGKPLKVAEKDLIVVSSTYATERDGSQISLTEPRKIGSSLLLSAFVVVQLLAISIVIFLLIAYYESLWDKIKCDSHNARGIYRSIMFLSAGFVILRVGVFIIACLRGSQFALSNPTVLQAFILSLVFALISPLAEMVVAFIIILKIYCESRKTQNEKITICGFTRQLCDLFVIFVFLQNIAAAAIPISVLLVMFPGEVISTLALISSSIACIVVFTAHIFHLDSPGRERSHTMWRSRAKIVSQAIALMLFIGLLGIVFVFYLLLLSQGLDDAGIVGFIVSLIPSGSLFYAAKQLGKKLLSEQTQNKSQDQTLTQTQNHKQTQTEEETQV